MGWARGWGAVAPARVSARDDLTAMVRNRQSPVTIVVTPGTERNVTAAWFERRILHNRAITREDGAIRVALRVSNGAEAPLSRPRRDEVIWKPLTTVVITSYR